MRWEHTGRKVISALPNFSFLFTSLEVGYQPEKNRDKMEWEEAPESCVYTGEKGVFQIRERDRRKANCIRTDDLSRKRAKKCPKKAKKDTSQSEKQPVRAPATNEIRREEQEFNLKAKTGTHDIKCNNGILSHAHRSVK